MVAGLAHKNVQKKKFKQIKKQKTRDILPSTAYLSNQIWLVGVNNTPRMI